MVSFSERENESSGLDDGRRECARVLRRLWFWVRGGEFGSGTSGGEEAVEVRRLPERLRSGHSGPVLSLSLSLWFAGLVGWGRGLLADREALAGFDFEVLADLEILPDLATSGRVLYTGLGFFTTTDPATGTGVTVGSVTACVKAKPKLMSPSTASLPDAVSVSLDVDTGFGFLFCAGDEGRVRFGWGGLNLKSKSGEVVCWTLFIRLRSAWEVFVPQEPLGWRSGICVGLSMLCV